MNPKDRACPKCRGTGKIVTSYGAICTEPIEKVKSALTSKARVKLVNRSLDRK